jgi:hypothetical protein
MIAGFAWHPTHSAWPDADGTGVGAEGEDCALAPVAAGPANSARAAATSARRIRTRGA